MLELLILSILLMFINILFCIRPIPILAIPFGLFTIYMIAKVFAPSSILPAQPYYSFLILMVSAISIFINGLSTAESGKLKNKDDLL